MLVALRALHPTNGGADMHRFSISRGVLGTGVLVFAVLIAVMAAAVTFASKPVRSARAPTVINGGARQWIAFDPDGRQIGPVQFLSKTVSIVNTSNASNAFTLYYEPAHLAICAGTLGAGAMSLCGVQPTQHLSGGYFQVIAAQPVLMGGRSEVPTIRYVQNPDGSYGADTSTGAIQNIPLVWQQGCPPRHGSGCPENSLSTGVTKNVGAKH
jgi:hypothetical protein